MFCWESTASGWKLCGKREREIFLIWRKKRQLSKQEGPFHKWYISINAVKTIIDTISQKCISKNSIYLTLNIRYFMNFDNWKKTQIFLSDRYILIFEPKLFDEDLQNFFFYQFSLTGRLFSNSKVTQPESHQKIVKLTDNLDSERETILFDNWKGILTDFQHRNHPSVGKILHASVWKYFELEHLPFRERP